MRHGRKILYTSYEKVNSENIVAVLSKVLPDFNLNRMDINYLWEYYKGNQPILMRVKEVRPEICNRIVENRANEIVAFKTGYLLGEPIQYVSRRDESVDKVSLFNDIIYADDKTAKDKELADWFHICGTGYRIIVPDEDDVFHSYVLDPRDTFVVYTTALGNAPVLGVKVLMDDNNVLHYYCYTDTEYFHIVGGTDIRETYPHYLGDVPIVEYPLNMARLGAFEIVLTLLDAINMTDSNRLDGVEQFVQALMLFHNVDISSEDFKALRDEGALKFRDVDPQMKADVSYLISNLSQNETQTLDDHFYDAILTICGMPNRNGGSSTSDTGSAVIMRDGWSAAETRAKNAEQMFKISEKRFLKMALRLCKLQTSLEINVNDIEIRFTRRNYENIYQKAQVLDLMLNNDKIAPILAFEQSGMFTDPNLAFSESEAYASRNNASGGGNDSGMPESGQQG